MFSVIPLRVVEVTTSIGQKTFRVDLSIGYTDVQRHALTHASHAPTRWALENLGREILAAGLLPSWKSASKMPPLREVNRR